MHGAVFLVDVNRRLHRYLGPAGTTQLVTRRVTWRPRDPAIPPLSVTVEYPIY